MLTDNERRMTFAKDKVLTALRTNREAHVQIVREAQSGFREKAIALLTERLKAAVAGEKFSLNIDLRVPDNHIDDFDRVIAMLEMTDQATVDLTDSEFQAYVRNKWSWEHMFIAANARYSETLARTGAPEFGGEGHG